MNREDLIKKIEIIKDNLNKDIELHLACTPSYDNEGCFVGFKTFFIEDYALELILINNQKLKFASVINPDQIKYMDGQIDSIIAESGNYDDLDAEDNCISKEEATEIWYKKFESTLENRSKQVKEIFQIENNESINWIKKNNDSYYTEYGSGIYFLYNVEGINPILEFAENMHCPHDYVNAIEGGDGCFKRAEQYIKKYEIKLNI